jgi:hypothetical protein
MRNRWKWSIMGVLAIILIIVMIRNFAAWYITSKYYVQRDKAQNEKLDQELKRKYEKLNVVLTSSLLNRKVVDVIGQLKLAPESLQSEAWIVGEIPVDLVEIVGRSKPVPIFQYIGARLDWKLDSGQKIQIACYFDTEDSFKSELRKKLSFTEISQKRVSGLEYLNSKEKVYEFIGTVPLNRGDDELWGRLFPSDPILKDRAKMIE